MFLSESVQRFGHTEVVLFSRDSNGKKVITSINDFRPYFYILESEKVPEDYRITGVEMGHTGILGEKLKKIYVKKSSDVVDIRAKFSKHWEADKIFNNRYIIDKIGPIEPYPLNVLYLDIETNSDNEFPDIANPNQEIISISMCDSFTSTETKLILRSDKWDKETHEHLLEEGCTIFDDEAALLGTFVSIFRKYDPDVISGWYVEKFDLTYLIKRMEQFDIPSRKLSPLNFVKINDKYKDVMIKGRIVSDMLKNYMHFRRISNQGKAESYSLEHTAQTLLKTGKLAHEESFREMWENDPIKLIRYNMRDVLLVKQIDEKLKIIDFFNQIRCLSCSNLKDIYHTSTLVDNLLLNKVHNKLVLPSAEKNEEDKFSGAHVILPVPGIYENIIALDVKGMYPNIIKTFNIGYETFNPNGNIKIGENIGFDSGIGVVSNIVRELEKERNKFKKLKKKAIAKGDNAEKQNNHYKQYAIKVLANAFFGYLGFPKSRLYKKEVANAITTLGREIIMWSGEVIKNGGHEIIYGDTDSTYIQSNHVRLIDILKEGKSLVSKINESYVEFATKLGADDCSLEIEFEKAFKKIMFVAKSGDTDEGAKKKYAYKLLWIDGENVDNKVHLKGFQVRRSDSPKIARDIQYDIINMVFNDESRENIIAYLEDKDRKIRNKTISIEDIGVPTEIKEKLGKYGRTEKRPDGTKYKTGTPPVVSGARYSNKYLGTNFEKGSKPKWLYIRSVPLGYPNTKIIAYDEEIPKGFVPDYDKITERIFRMKLEKIFQAANFGEFPDIDTTKARLPF